MCKNERLAENVVTPTTKAVDHDVPISAVEIVEQGLMSQADWDLVRRQSEKGIEQRSGQDVIVATRFRYHVYTMGGY